MALLPLSIRETLGSWLSCLGIPLPEVLAKCDLRALEQALAELVGEPDLRRVEEDRIESLGDWVLELRTADGFARLAAGLERRPEFAGLVRRLDWLYQRVRASELPAEVLRAARREVLEDFLALMEESIEQRARQISHAKDERERCLARRFPPLGILSDLDPVESSAEPGVTCSARECARRVVKVTRSCLSPTAFAALRALLLDPAATPARLLAPQFGVSDSTLSRARSMLVEIARREAQDLPPAARLVFATEVLAAIRDAA